METSGEFERSSVTEKRMWKAILKRWRGHAVRVEASEGGVDPGFPDGILSVGGRGGFIELKVWPEELRPTQLPWHLDAIQRGAYARVLCCVGHGAYWLGTAEEYQELLDRGERPNGDSLQAGLAMVVCALSGSREPRN